MNYKEEDKAVKRITLNEFWNTPRRYAIHCKTIVKQKLKPISYYLILIKSALK